MWGRDESYSLLGRTLHWDGKTWTVKNDLEANMMLTRDFRARYLFRSYFEI